MAEDNSRFDRQRRNLMLSSALLFVIYVAEITPTQINLIGNKADIDNPLAFTYFLLVLHGWWIYRYYVYYNETIINLLEKTIHNYATQLITANEIEIFADHKSIKSDDFSKCQLKYKTKSFSGIKTDGTVTIGYEDPSFYDNGAMKSLNMDTVSIELPRGVIDEYKNEARKNVLHRYSYVSEYLAPFIIALVPISVAVVMSVLDY